MNNLGRPTTDPKQQTVKLRLNDDMREFIEAVADHNGITMSEYIRRLIENDMTARTVCNGDGTQDCFGNYR